LKLIKRYNNLELIIEEKLLNEIGDIGIKYFPNEFGGFLIGKYLNNYKSLYIENFILPFRYKQSPLYFERSINGIRDKFKKAFKDNKQYYIGEWHTHPNGPTMFSQTDLTAMIQIVKCKTVQIKNPILLILSVNDKKINNYTFYFYKNREMIAYE